VPSTATNAATRREWRELGFFYDLDDGAKAWNIVGAATGVSRFCELLRMYASDSRHEAKSEHAHYGPYQYLKVVTSTEARLDGHAISGRLDDLLRLAALVESKLQRSAAGGEFVVGADWAPRSDYVLRIAVRDDGFDPASADALCQDSPPC
jgi:hypothetical protein